MKRIAAIKPDRYRHGIYSHYALFFWKECASCKQEFRREHGWHYLGGPIYNGMGHRYYLCATCAPDRNTAHELACASVHVPPCPWPPPAAEPPAS